ncbi:MAG: single-stranded DNA-binding protein [Clostridiales bacterium]|nr:single-stranded DNA-binding protein [Clostridiales bacterium]
MNKIILIGNLTRDPDAGNAQNGGNFTRFNVAVNRPFTNAAGERLADYFDVICWNKLAERCAKYLFKGSKVGISGYVQRRQYEDRDGIKRTSFDVVADEVEFLTPRNNGTGGERTQGGYVPEDSHPISDMQPVESDDLPF